MSAPELAACPFCGGEAKYILAMGVACRDCGGCLPCRGDEQDAWNRRSPSLTALRAQVETLREALQGLRDCIQETRGKNAHDAVEAADAALLLATLKAVEAQND